MSNILDSFCTGYFSVRHKCFSQILLTAILIIYSCNSYAVLFTKIADTNTQIPGGTGNYTGFSVASISGNTVVFHGSGNNESGIYKSTAGVISTVADTNTAAPNGVGNFTILDPLNYGYGLAVDDSSIVFVAQDSDSNIELYKYNGSVLQEIVGTTTQVQGSTETFELIFLPSADDGRTSFISILSNGLTGIYLHDGSSVSLVADNNTPYPGGAGTMGSNGSHDQNNGRTVFIANNSANTQSGIFVFDGSNFIKVVDTGTLVPGASTIFSYFDIVSMHGDQYAFGASSSLTQGIYLSKDNSLELVVDQNTQLPGGIGNYSYINGAGLSVDNNRVIFSAVSSTGMQGIYYYQGGLLRKIIDTNDTLSGNTISDVALSNESQSGNIICFVVNYTNGTSAIYTADIGDGVNTLDHFTFLSHINDVSVDSQITVPIEAVLSNGQRDTSFNGYVVLSTNNSSQTVSPELIPLVNGYASVDLTIDVPGKITVLQARHSTIDGISNSFEVTDHNTTPNYLLAVFINSRGRTVSFQGAQVALKDSSGNIITPDTTGHPLCTTVRYDNLDLGTYSFHAYFGADNKAGYAKEVVIKPGRNTVRVVMRDTTKQPVLLVPGILGSTIEGFGDYSDFNTYPQLTKNAPTPASELKILDGADKLATFFYPFADAGFSEFADKIESDYSVHTVPWDWRISLECPPQSSCINAWLKYLRPAIDHAKDPDHDGIPDFQKVHVVAHSMGGLLTRAYIQSPYYENDIDKFAMVGTPNLGSANAYYMVNGGDPVKTDQIHNDCMHGYYILGIHGLKCFYSRATSDLYRKIYGKYPFDKSQPPPWMGIFFTPDANLVIDQGLLSSFYEAHVPTGRQLLPTYKFLSTPGVSLRKLSEVKNDFLENLNNVDLSNYYTKADDTGSPDKVCTKIFASHSVDTLSFISVSDAQPASTTYKDGKPLGKELPIGRGDGTVHACSAALRTNILGGIADCGIQLGLEEALNDRLYKPWATLLADNKGSHALLVGRFDEEIHDFLLNGCTTP